MSRRVYSGTSDTGNSSIDYFAGIRPTPQPEVFPEPSDREREILDLIAQGHKNPEIAKRLYLILKTVRNHVSNILHKLQAVDRTEAVIRAREAGLAYDRRESTECRSK